MSSLGFEKVVLKAYRQELLHTAKVWREEQQSGTFEVSVYLMLKKYTIIWMKSFKTLFWQTWQPESYEINVVLMR